jgi:sn-glycerol 3-phosphate transport system substrate-binding protein
VFEEGTSVRKTLRRRVGAVAAMLAMAVTASACSSAATSGDSSSGDDVTAPGKDALDGKGEVGVTFWHGMSGTNGETLQALVDQFNNDHKGKIKVTLNYKGQYDSVLASYKNASEKQRPDMMQMYDIGTRYMIDSNTTVPMQSFIDVDKHDVSDLQPNIAGYYTVDDKLYSMPFNTSMPLMYVNREAFTKAGLDPDKPPTDLDEIMAAAKKIKTTPGETVQYGFGASLYGWFVEQWNAVADTTLCDADNGRTGRASKVTLANDTNVKLVQWWQDMVDQGLAMKLDSNTDNGDNAFSSGTVAMSLESTGSLGTFTAGAKASKNPFTVGTGFYPKVDAANDGGPIIGGASLWIMHKDDPAKQRAAWELVKFLSQKDTQVTWHTKTGYFPISKAALDDPADKQWVSQKPQFSTAIEQLQGTKLTHATQGCSVGEMPEVRKNVENALQAAILQGTDAKQALTDAQNAADKQIAAYNDKLGG